MSVSPLNGFQGYGRDLYTTHTVHDIYTFSFLMISAAPIRSLAVCHDLERSQNKVSDR